MVATCLGVSFNWVCWRLILLDIEVSEHLIVACAEVALVGALLLRWLLNNLDVLSVRVVLMLLLHQLVLSLLASLTGLDLHHILTIVLRSWNSIFKSGLPRFSLLLLRIVIA